jgi:DNA-binding NarL/FixJ family response regulator
MHDDVAPNLVEKQIYVIGPHQLQNELMASFIENGTGVRCFVGDDIRRVPRTGREAKGQKLILLDCRERGAEELLAEVRPENRGFALREFLAMFNLNEALEIEQEALALGVRGFFYEHDHLETLLKGVRAILAEEFWVSRYKLARILEESCPGSPEKGALNALTAREKEVLTSLVQGATNEMIAKKLFISPHTVKTHIYHIFRKLKVTNRLQAAQWAMKHLL